MTQKFRKAVNTFLREERMSIGGLARTLSINSDTLRKFLTEETRNITLDNFEKISKFIGFKYSEDL